MSNNGELGPPISVFASFNAAERCFASRDMSRAPRILIVEDDASVRRLFERVLSEDGYHVISVATGRHALLILRDAAFDMVIVDMSLPDLAGPDVIEQIVTEYPHIKAVAASGAMEQHMQRLARRAGAGWVVRKPISPAQLRISIYAALDPTCSWRSGGGDL